MQGLQVSHHALGFQQGYVKSSVATESMIVALDNTFVTVLPQPLVCRMSAVNSSTKTIYRISSGNSSDQQHDERLTISANGYPRQSTKN